jgi:hypothetical protein
MGPIERQVMEKGGFGGKSMSLKEMDEIRELDGMMSGMGNIDLNSAMNTGKDDDY